MSQQEGGSADLSPQEARTPIPEFLTISLAWVGLGTLTSLALASVAFTQGAWNSDKVAETRTSAVEPDRAGEELSSVYALPDSAPGLPAAGATSRPKPDRAPAHRPAEDPLEASEGKSGGSGSRGSTGGASREGGDTPTPRDTSENKESRLATEVRPSLAAWSSRKPEDNPYWDAHAVTVRSNVPITSLKVSVRVIQTGGVANTGVWTSLGDQVEVHAAADGDQLAYVAVLKPGVTLQPGTHTFQFGFNHDMGNRDSSRDLWNVAAEGGEFTGSQVRSGRF